MDERIIVSGSGEVRAYDRLMGNPTATCMLKGAGALCAAQAHVYVSSHEDGVIWRLSGNSLIPTGVFAGGPGISQMMLSEDAIRLYALCSDADSLLMLDAATGTPLILSRVGANPCSMAMDEQGEAIVVAGGSCGEVLILCARSLKLMKRFAVSGIVFSAAIQAGTVYALSLNETMDSVLTFFLPGGERKELRLPGLPGAIMPLKHGIVAATHRSIVFVSHDGSTIYASCGTPGRAGRLGLCQNGLLMTDVWTDSIFLFAAYSGRWKQIIQGSKDFALV